MAFSDVARGQGSFVSRTKVLTGQNLTNRSNSILVAQVAPDSIFEPTGSNVSTAFMIVSQSTVDSAATNGSFKLSEGGVATDKTGYETGTLYPIALSYVSSSVTGPTVDLYR